MLYLQNSYGKRQSASADVGDTRHVSLAGEEKCDLQIVALERQDSFSSSSTDYEEIDLSEKSYHESEDNESDLDLVNSGSDDDFQSDSPKDDPEMENQEDSDGGLSEDDNVRNDTILTEEFAAENDNFSDQKDVDDHDILTDEDEFENISNDDEDEEEMNRDSEDNLENNSEQLEDEMADSDNEISISNDISITIANESLIVNSGVNLEIVDDEVDNNSELNQVDGSVSESINKNSLLSLQRIIVSRSDSEEEKDNHIESKTKTVDRNHSNGSQVPQEKGSKRDNPVVESVTVNTSPANIKTKVAPVNKGKLKQAISKSETSTNVTVTSLQEGKKSTSKPLTGEKQGIVTSSNFQNSKDLPPKEKSKDKDKENQNSKQVIQKCNEIVSVNAVSLENKAKTSGNKAISLESKATACSAKDATHENKATACSENDTNHENKATTFSEKAIIHESKAKMCNDMETKPLVIELKSETKNEEKMDFDQLSIEDEDSDFEEEEENPPTVKSRVGLKKIPTDCRKRRRSNSKERDRKKRSHSPERSRTSSRSYHSHLRSRDRLQDQHLHNRFRERHLHRRSHSPSTDRIHRRQNYSHRQRSRSRDRKHERISRDSQNNRHHRSHSRSDSRTRSRRTRKLVESNIEKSDKRDSMKSDVKKHLERKDKSKDKITTTHSSTSPRKEMRNQDKSDTEKMSKVRGASSTIKHGASESKSTSKHTVQRDVDGAIIVKPKG